MTNLKASGLLGDLCIMWGTAMVFPWLFQNNRRIYRKSYINGKMFDVRGGNMLNQIGKTVPNLFMIGNLLCGVLSITSNMSGFLELSSILTSLAFILFPTMGALRLAKFSVKPT